MRLCLFTVVLVTVLAVFPANSTLAQFDCWIGAFGDEDGTHEIGLNPREPGDLILTFDVYYVLFTEDFANAVAWNREVVLDCGSDLFLASRDAVPTYGTFLDIQPEGFRLGIGSCVIGFGGVPITVMKETFGFLQDWCKSPQPPLGHVSVLPNVLENPDYPVYNTCNDAILPCRADSNPVLPVSNEPPESWGRVKALFAAD